MIELPDSPAPNGMEPEMLDYGGILRGASSLRLNRPGARYRFGFSYPFMRADVARIFTARLERAKSDGIRIEIPLLGETQGFPGAPVVDGAGQAGRSLVVRGLTPQYIAREGFWLTVREADDTGYVHRIADTVVADASGLAALPLTLPLRAPFSDGDAVNLGKPTVEGFIDGDTIGWSVGTNRLVAPSFAVEEYQ